MAPSVGKECRRRGQSHRPGEEGPFLYKAKVIWVLIWTQEANTKSDPQTVRAVSRGWKHGHQRGEGRLPQEHNAGQGLGSGQKLSH